MKENILFGQPFDVEKYSAVIYACALVEARNFLSYCNSTPFDPLKSRGHNIQDRITFISLCLHYFPSLPLVQLEYKHLTVKISALFSEILLCRFAFSPRTPKPGWEHVASNI